MKLQEIPYHVVYDHAEDKLVGLFVSMGKAIEMGRGGHENVPGTTSITMHMLDFSDSPYELTRPETEPPPESLVPPPAALPEAQPRHSVDVYTITQNSTGKKFRVRSYYDHGTQFDPEKPGEPIHRACWRDESGHSIEYEKMKVLGWHAMHDLNNSASYWGRKS